MKKMIAVVAFAGLSSVAMAEHGPAGCGLGTEYVFPDATEWYEHVLAATTNGSSGNQSFGMTSGTLGCKDANGPLATNTQKFMDDNMDQLAADVAVGKGETLDALAEVMAIDAADRGEFAAALQANFARVFNAEATSASAMDQVNAVLAESVRLNKYAA
ncbi:DUF3015 family protein [Oceanobacter mangrovi]|uniref:DUF3015 family protein n=1 Tax=Oceanobacter mangrovi TaxID=2862510 RepID=UPI001C8E17B2|nr:DUF3015 family protein [Oceanobacter mangrovi]